MRRWIILLAAMLGFLLLPSAGTELSQLRPAAVLYVSAEGNQIRIQTDTEDKGIGETLDAAIQNMRKSAPGIVYLDTVERLLITDRTAYLIPQLKEILRPTVRICKTQGEIDLQTAGEYLQTHIPDGMLADVISEKELQNLSHTEGRYILE